MHIFLNNMLNVRLLGHLNNCLRTFQFISNPFYESCTASYRSLLHVRKSRYFYARKLQSALPFQLQSCREKSYSRNQNSDYNQRQRFYNKFRLILGISSAAGIGLVHGSDDEENRKICLAAKCNNLHDLKNLVNSPLEANVRHPYGWTPLIVAVMNNSKDCIKYLLKNGADPNLGDEFTNYQNVSNQTRHHPLIVLTCRDEEFTDKLNTFVNFGGSTPLHYAAIVDDVEVVDMLLEKGADPTIRNYAGHSVVQYAVQYSECESVLKEAVDCYQIKLQERKAEERRKYPLEKRLSELIVGQEAAIATVAGAIRRKENGWHDDDHPLVFLFLGSSGIGKTELAKQVAAYLYKDTPKAFIRLDMSEYQEKHEVAKFIGSPPGYVGHESGGQLTKKLSECPNSVVLFDEVDKAHPDVLTIMLQLFDEGRITDGQGTTIACKEALFIMTSNLASQEIATHGQMLRKEIDSDDKPIAVRKDFKDQIIRPILKRHFRRDEFLGRINEFVYFLPFSGAELRQLVARELSCWAVRAAKRHSIQIDWESGLLDALAAGYDVHYGARSIKYEVERRVVNKLATAHENRVIVPGAAVRVYVDEAGQIRIAAKAATSTTRT